MKYKGYTAAVEYDDELGMMTGYVVNTRDQIYFEGRSVDELRQAFEDSVDDYLVFCEEQGLDPAKPFSGSLRLRLAPDLHRDAATTAAARGMSLNAFISEATKVAVGT